MKITVFVPTSSAKAAAGLVNVDLEIIFPSVVQLVGITQALEGLGAKIGEYDNNKRSLNISMPQDLTLGKVQSALGSAHELAIEPNLAKHLGTKYNENYKFSYLLINADQQEVKKSNTFKSKL